MIKDLKDKKINKDRKIQIKTFKKTSRSVSNSLSVSLSLFLYTYDTYIH